LDCEFYVELRMIIKIERRNPGIVAHLLKKELRSTIDKHPWMRKSVRAVITSPDKFLVIVENKLDNVKTLELVLSIVERFFKDYEIKKVSEST